VADVEAAVAFYERVFGLARRVLLENGPMGLYAELDTGPTTLAIADHKEARTLFPEHRTLDDGPPVLAQLSFVSDDVPAAFTRALAAGAVPLAEPTAQPWGQTVARVRAPHGALVSIVTSPPAS
jgi:uncharacterized glyoxalase superfamily protein PhnB